MKLYEYAIMLHPTKKELEEEGKQSEIIVPVKQVVAANENAAVMLAGRSIPEQFLNQVDRIEVAVRPF